ncbi:MAG: Methyltransferase type 11 [Parcubacteria group bacterium GW2011_GWA2_47_7]|nr:MAG: Methyltransferase type 11 [Parcubacteria group bacterium GW2011_GWA2_47_7]
MTEGVVIPKQISFRGTPLDVEEVQRRKINDSTMAARSRSKEILLELDLVRESTIELFSPRVRDRDDIGVLRDSGSGIIFLDRTDHIDITHYETVKEGAYWGADDRSGALETYDGDDMRRGTQFKQDLAGKDVVDIGCGTGGFMDIINPSAKSVAGVELQAPMRATLERLGYEMYRLPADVPARCFDVATLFHTLEHLTEPLEVLREIRAVLRPGGTVIIEVPHARDALLELDAFKAFSLWSEHLILHTRESLWKFLENAGFHDIAVEGYQRYPLSNHIGWLLTGLPGGQKKFSDFDKDGAADAYSRLLAERDSTDTLIAIAHV